ncbi:hypothetical protein M8J75_004744 [Diaphorina citri]|nr:hypothetical protein M8J75_004744 [Diaphorina citri]
MRISKPADEERRGEPQVEIKIVRSRVISDGGRKGGGERERREEEEKKENEGKRTFFPGHLSYKANKSVFVNDNKIQIEKDEKEEKKDKEEKDEAKLEVKEMEEKRKEGHGTFLRTSANTPQMISFQDRILSCSDRVFKI